ncbi:ATP-dependent zinc protease [Vibrio mexicanus]|uniref:ATP-dependent zinc protease family protein n=1 Tax=Vibrio mexicanus TaxID=1004326 RepID=UPI00063C81A0|nr:ATP-dependent zinc protease [Vibrio mexicanus]
MNKALKLVLALMLTGGLAACTTTQAPVEPETPAVEQPEPEVEQPEVEPQTEPEVTEPEKPVEPEPKPEPKPEPEPEKVQKTADGKLILGQNEWVYFPGLEDSFKARVDSGATTSSVSAVDIVPFERDGNDWVKFKIQHDGINSDKIALPVQRWAKIKQSNNEEGEKRAVVVAWIQVGDVKEKTEFTLTDRTHLEYPILLGRSFFKDIAIVDVSQKYVQDKFKK